MFNIENFSIIAFYGKIVKNTSLMNTRYYNEIVPCTKSKIFMPNPNKKYPIAKKPKLPLPYTEKQFGPRRNKLDIQMLSKAIYDQVFKPSKDNYNAEVVEQCNKELLKHGMQIKESDFLKDVDYKVPPLKGDDIEDHFRIIGEEQAKPYRDLVLQLLETVPEPPSMWVKQAGWTRYESGCEPQKVPYPLEEALVFDIEVCMAAGKSPTVATAVSSRAWYSWVSHTLIDKTSKPVTNSEYPITSLIPVESNATDNGLDLNDHQTKPKVIIGHNVSYDRARIKEQYWMRKTGTRFVDTMSLHVCVGGLTSYQRAVLKSQKFTDEDESWKSCSSLNSLADCYKLYCGKKIDKATRDLFVEGTLPDINENFQKVMKYCSNDVMATYGILKVLFPLFLERFAHPVTLAEAMSRATKRKHVLHEILQDDFSPPTDTQQIVRIINSRGNNLHEVQAADKSVFLVSMPSKFRKNVWVKRGDYVLVEPIEEGDKVKAEMVRILSNEHIKTFKKDNLWPAGFDEDNRDEHDDEDDVFKNTNRPKISESSDTESSSSDEGR